MEIRPAGAQRRQLGQLQRPEVDHAGRHDSRLCFLMYSPPFSRTSWASGSSFWSGLRSPLIFRTPRPVYVHRREFPVLLELDAVSVWASISHLRPGGRLVLRAPRLFSCVLCIGGDYSLRLLRGASSLVHWGGTYLSFDAHTFVRTAVCLPPVYCCFVVSWLFDVRARYCGPGRVFQAPFNRRSPQLRSIAFHTAPRIL